MTILSLKKFLTKSILFFVLFFVLSVKAQEPFIRKISFLEGLPSDVIYDMYVSKKGLLYLGTDKGLVSYDGVHFTLYPFDKNLSNSVNSIQEDENGVIYCKNFSNQIYFLSNERLNLDKAFNDLISKKKLSIVDFSVLGKQKVLLTSNQFFGIASNKHFVIYQSNLVENDFYHLSYNTVSNEFYISSLDNILSFKNNSYLKEKDCDAKKLYVAFLSKELQGSAINDLKISQFKPDEATIDKSRIYIKYAVGAGKTRLDQKYIEKKLNVVATILTSKK